MAAAAETSVKDFLDSGTCMRHFKLLGASLDSKPTAGEKEKMKQVILALAEAGVDDEMIGFREVLITTMATESVEDAVTQYRVMLGVLQEHKLTLKDLYDPEVMSKVQNHFVMFGDCGKDKDGLGIMWIMSQPVPVKEEQVSRTMLTHLARAQTQILSQPGQNSVIAGMLYWMAVHSDITTLRKGVTLVVESTDSAAEKIGNERKLRQTYFSLPLRAPNIYILGAGFFKRMLINGLIRLTQMFKSGVQNVQFVEIETVHEVVPEKSRPDYSLSPEDRVVRVREYMQQRLSMYPVHIGSKNCLSQFE